MKMTMKQIADELLGATITGEKDGTITYRPAGHREPFFEPKVKILQYNPSCEITKIMAAGPIDFVADSGEVYSGNQRVGFVL